MNERAQLLQSWCKKQSVLQGLNFDFSMVSGDASFRRYFRLRLKDTSYIAVDAPPEYEDSQQFCKVARIFAEQGVNVPEVLATDFDLGFMLLSDLGDRQLLSEINESNAEQYYALAFDEIIKIQNIEITNSRLPLYDHHKLMEEMTLFQTWFIRSLLNLELSEKESQIILSTQLSVAEMVLKQKQVYVHRDFHSRNLMLLGTAEGLEIALIDFQDALLGAITYDAVSLLKDCYIEWSVAQRKLFLTNYFNQLCENSIIDKDMKFEAFYRDFELMGLQRHLKILGIFSRLSIRDGKNDYLKDLPLTFKYIEEALSAFPELNAFTELFSGKIKQKFVEQSL